MANVNWWKIYSDPLVPKWHTDNPGISTEIGYVNLIHNWNYSIHSGVVSNTGPNIWIIYDRAFRDILFEHEYRFHWIGFNFLTFYDAMCCLRQWYTYWHWLWKLSRHEMPLIWLLIMDLLFHYNVILANEAATAWNVRGTKTMEKVTRINLGT